MKTAFETETCGRCGGSGNYSFNLMNGTRCFGCRGSGLKLTKRGVAARAFFTRLLEKPLSIVEPGHRVLTSVGLGPQRWHTVVSIGPSAIEFNGKADRLELKIRRGGETHSIAGYGRDTIVQSVRDEAERLAAVERALAYQATLTKAGKPAKTKEIAA